jgi:hypothetical protein
MGERKKGGAQEDVVVKNHVRRHVLRRRVTQPGDGRHGNGMLIPKKAASISVIIDAAIEEDNAGEGPRGLRWKSGAVASISADHHEASMQRNS